jgi:predicted glycogen debranching enzyme
VEYPIDRERGEVCEEDWWSPGEFTLTLNAGESRSLICSTESTSSLDAEQIVHVETERRRACKPRPSGVTIVDALCTAATSYPVRFTGGSASLAGFPWFDVWTRDTFTSFAGLYLATGDFVGARKVLETFAPLVQRGMLPANLPDARTKPRWNAADASLWFVISVGRYVRESGNESVLGDFGMDAVRAILDGHAAGEPPHIRVADDGLVHASSPDHALTWMDADYKGHVMTPRRGKPVEIQALWVHALGIAADLADQTGDAAFAARCRVRRNKAVASFQARFWNAKTGHLFDVVDGPEGDDPTLRPNQIFAIALDDDLVPRDRAAAVLRVVDERLRTPLGLRTLPADDPDYHPHYVGDRSKRDPAYHQGTVWPFLLGPFIGAWMRVRGPTEQTRREALSFLVALEEHINGDACFGHLSEIFDADPPHRPRGCFAQAWSGGELLYALHEHVLHPRTPVESSMRL